jgi:hypothetical protein
MNDHARMAKPVRMAIDDEDKDFIQVWAVDENA